MSLRKSPHNFHGRHPMTALEATADYIDLIADGLDGIPESAKVIARRVGSTPRTVENWKQRLCGPKGLELLRLCRAYPEIWDRIAAAVEPVHEAEARARLDTIKQRRAALAERIAQRENVHGNTAAGMGREASAGPADSGVGRLSRARRAA